MSKITEMVEAEASLVESESPEPEPEPEPSGPEPSEPEPEPSPEGALEPSMQAALAKFDAENERHERNLAKLMGEDFESFEPCPTCASVGFRVSASMVYDETLEPCPKCQGHGYMLTPTRREDRGAIECIHCGGNGYCTKVTPPAPEQPSEPSRPLFDPYTGERLPVGQDANGAPQYGGFAPGYVPPPQPVPGAPSAP